MKFKNKYDNVEKFFIIAMLYYIVKIIVEIVKVLK